MIMTIGRWRRDRIRHAMRAYRRLKTDGRLGIVHKTSALLTETPLPIAPSQVSERFFGAAFGNAELAIRQYLYLRQVLYKLPLSLVTAAADKSSTLIYPVPVAWLDRFREAGFAIGVWRSRLAWGVFAFLYWAYGCLVILGILGASARAGLSAGKTIGRFAHFENINRKQTPRPASDGRSFDMMSWYRGWPDRAPDLQSLTFRVRSAEPRGPDLNVHTARLPVRAVLSPAKYASLVAWCMWAAGLSLFDLIRGRWWHALMLGEAALTRLTREVPQDGLARDYLFNNSGWLYRPLWSYEAEQRGARILFYHYSTNSAMMKRPEGYPDEHYTWAITNWPVHLVWDKEQAAFVERATGQSNTQVVGPIWFSSIPETVDDIEGPSIAVFDVQPFRPAKLPSLALDFNYYSLETCTAFIEDAARIADQLGATLVWKRKRGIGKEAHPKYRALANCIDEKGLALAIAPDQSAIRIIERVDAVVSMPFTSTALLAREMGKPCCYYDPHGLIDKLDRCARDVPILVGPEELVTWMKAVRSVSGTHVGPNN